MHSKREKNLRDAAAFLLLAIAAVVIGALWGGEGGRAVTVIGALVAVFALVSAASELLRSR